MAQSPQRVYVAINRSMRSLGSFKQIEAPYAFPYLPHACPDASNRRPEPTHIMLAGKKMPPPPPLLRYFPLFGGGGHGRGSISRGHLRKSRMCCISAGECAASQFTRHGQDTRLAQRLRLGIAPKGIRVRPRYRSNFVRSPRHLTI